MVYVRAFLVVRGVYKSVFIYACLEAQKTDTWSEVPEALRTREEPGEQRKERRQNLEDPDTMHQVVRALVRDARCALGN